MFMVLFSFSVKCKGGSLQSRVLTIICGCRCKLCSPREVLKSGPEQRCLFFFPPNRIPSSFYAAMPEGQKITDIQYWFSGFWEISGSFNIKHWKWWNPIMISNVTPKSFHKAVNPSPALLLKDSEMLFLYSIVFLICWQSNLITCEMFHHFFLLYMTFPIFSNQDSFIYYSVFSQSLMWALRNWTGYYDWLRFLCFHL